MIRDSNHNSAQRPIQFTLPFAVLLAVTTVSQATTLNGKVTAVYAYGNKGMVDTSVLPPACGISGWAFDLSTAAGQAKYATALTAYSTNRTVNIIGTGACSDWPDRETINSIGVIQ